jgi:hypothetical protein
MLARSLPLLLCAGPAAAETLVVNASGQSPFSSVQQAIDAGADGDVILVFPGTYGPADLGAKNLVLLSTGGPLVTTIDAAGVPGPALVIAGQQGPQTLVLGFTLTGGTGFLDPTVSAWVGGGLYVGKDARPRVAGNVIAGNTADFGGGVGVIDASPLLLSNIVEANVAAVAGGGTWIQGAASSGEPTVSGCETLRGNTGAAVGGLYVGTAPVELWNPILSTNSGERGGAWLTLGASGLLLHPTIFANQGGTSAAGGLELEGAGVSVGGALVVDNVGAWGVLRSVAGPWTYNDVVGNSGAAYGGPLGDPTGLDGNLSQVPQFLLATPQDPYDDDLSLVAGDPLWNLGDPAPGALDLDGSRAAMGADGGPRTGCDLDGDGVGPTDLPADCRPLEGAFHPHAYEVDDGLDLDCDGWGTQERVELVLNDGGFASDGGWAFAAPTALPGRGFLGIQAWCTGCTSPPPGGTDTSLERSFDLSALPPGSPVRLLLVHAWSGADGQDGGAVDRWDGSAWVDLPPEGGYPGTLDALAPGNALVAEGRGSAFTGDSGGYVLSTFRLDVDAGGLATVRLRHATASSGTGLGWTVARALLQVIDADGDGRAATLADCDDDDPTVFVGAVETPYDGVDQDCILGDLVDVDGDSVVAQEAGGGDCDDGDPQIAPGAAEVPYDGIDQDCDGLDLTDVDGDGADGPSALGSDCDDGDITVHPGAIDVPYDGIDQDCDGTDLADADGDGWDATGGPPDWDCDDSDPAIHPGAIDDCGDGIDDNCDGAIDFQLDLDGDDRGPCDGDCDDGEPAVFPGAPELCDGLDNDCDGVVHGAELDLDGDGVRPCGGDCDDFDPAVGGRPDACDGLDNDCDGEVDEGHDIDGDGFSSCLGADCDDLRAVSHPGAPIRCEEPGDADCNGLRDDEEEACAPPAGCGGCDAGGGGSGQVLSWMLGGLVLARGRPGRRGTTSPQANVVPRPARPLSSSRFPIRRPAS